MRQTRSTFALLLSVTLAVGGGVLLGAGCAQGSESTGDDDGFNPDARTLPIDGSLPIDSSLPIDAPMQIDASVPIDASLPIDASSPIDGGGGLFCSTTADCAGQAGTCCFTLGQPPGFCVPGAEIAGVFVNRLRQGWRLQTDPTVIYGLGDAFDGNLRRVDLETDTPYNTYTRFGLPPTPIALPGRAAIAAALQPARTEAMFFVARGEGSNVFSRTLEEHNRAVRRFQLGLQ